MAERDEHTVTCPGCGWSRVTRSAGVTITCRRCQTRHYVPAIGQDRRGQRDPVRVTCRHCATPITTRARPQSAIKCPGCGRSVWVPVAAPAVGGRTVEGRPVEGGRTVQGRPAEGDRSVSGPPRRPTPQPAARPARPQPAPARPTTPAPTGPSLAAVLGQLLGGGLTGTGRPPVTPPARPPVTRPVTPPVPPARRPDVWAATPTRPAATPAAPTGTTRRGGPLRSIAFRTTNVRSQCEVYFVTEGPCIRAIDGTYTYRGRQTCSEHYWQLRDLDPGGCAVHHPNQQLVTGTNDEGLTTWGL